MKETVNLPVHVATESPIRTAHLGADRLAVHVGRPEPRLWIVNEAGQIAQEIELPTPLEANPVLLDAGLVLPLPDRLTLVARADGPPVKDYPAPLEEGVKPRWGHLLPIDGDELLAINTQGRLVRIQYKTSPMPHLDEVDRLELGKPIDVPPAIAAGRLFVADAAGRLKMFGLDTMDLLADVKLAAPASRQPWIVDGELYVETGHDRLHCYRIGTDLKLRWPLPLGNSPLAGSPRVFGDRLVMALRNGEVWVVNPADGVIASRRHIGQPAVLGPQPFGEFLVLPTIDGSLQRIESLLDAAEDRGTK